MLEEKLGFYEVQLGQLDRGVWYIYLLVAEPRNQATSASHFLLQSENVESWLAWQVGLRKFDKIIICYRMPM
jgi:hypothetical protein